MEETEEVTTLLDDDTGDDDYPSDSSDDLHKVGLNSMHLKSIIQSTLLGPHFLQKLIHFSQCNFVTLLYSIHILDPRPCKTASTFSLYILLLHCFIFNVIFSTL